MRVCILGAGVGGLTTAHKLAKKGHEVHIIERNPEVGGLARTCYTSKGEHSEIAWRVFMNTYTNLTPVLQEIPFNGQTVADQLRPIAQQAYGFNGDNFLVENYELLSSGSVQQFLHSIKKAGRQFTVKDLCKLALLKTFVAGSIPERFEKYDKVTWYDYMSSLSANARQILVHYVHTICGGDVYKFSTHAMLAVCRNTKNESQFFVQKFQPLIGEVPQYYCLNGPTNQQVFDPWVEHLKNLNVLFFLNTKVKEVRCGNGRVSEVVILNPNSESEKSLQYDFYVNGLDVKSFTSVLCGADELKKQMFELNSLSNLHMPQITYSFREKINFGSGTIILHFPYAPWALIIRPEGPLWEVPLGKSEQVPGELLKVAICDLGQKGILYNKTVSECTEQELAEETWAQIKQSSGLLKHFKAEDGRTLDDLSYTSYNIWHSFGYDHASGTFRTWEPKFSNNVGTLPLRPWTQQHGLTNLVHANGYTRTDTDIYSMEAAAEAGIRAANFIEYGKPVTDTPKFSQPGKFWSFFQYFDRILFKSGVPNVPEMMLHKL